MNAVLEAGLEDRLGLVSYSCKTFSPRYFVLDDSTVALRQAQQVRSNGHAVFNVTHGRMPHDFVFVKTNGDFLFMPWMSDFCTSYTDDGGFYFEYKNNFDALEE